MSYPKELHIRADRILTQRRDTALAKAEAQSERIRAAVPEIDRVMRELSQIGIEISRLYFYQGDVQKKIAELRNKSKALVEERETLLLKNGYTADAMEPHFVCAACEDRGFIDNRLCNCRKQVLKDLMREEVSRMAPLERCTFESFKLSYYSDKPLENSVVPRTRAEKIYDAAMRYAQSFSPGSKSLVFLGGTGLGKTHLSLAIANVVINRGYSVCYGTSHNICEEQRSEMFGRSEGIYYTKERVLEYDLLILDDLGTEIDNPYNIGTLYNIINTRSLAGKPTVISTNYELNELMEKYDQRITSRVSGDFTQLKLFGSDIRTLKRHEQ